MQDELEPFHTDKLSNMPLRYRQTKGKICCTHRAKNDCYLQKMMKMRDNGHTQKDAYLSARRVPHHALFFPCTFYSALKTHLLSGITASLSVVCYFSADRRLGAVFRFRCGVFSISPVIRKGKRLSQQKCRKYVSARGINRNTCSMCFHYIY